MTPERMAEIRQWAWTQRNRTIAPGIATTVEELCEYIELLERENITLQDHINADHVEWNRQIDAGELGKDRPE